MESLVNLKAWICLSFRTQWMFTLYWKEGLLLLMAMCALAAPIVAQSHQDSYHIREEQNQREATAREFYEEHGWAYGVRLTQGTTV